MLKITNLRAMVAGTQSAKIRTSFFVAIAITSAAFPEQSLAAGATGGGALLPFLLQYDLCAYSGPAPDQESVRARCAGERERLTAAAEPVIAHFYPAARLDARRKVQLEFAYADRDAAKLARIGQPYGPDVLRYSQCLVENALADPDYRRGTRLDGQPIARKCQPLYDELSRSLSTGSATVRTRQRLSDLKQLFTRLYATPASAFDAGLPMLRAE